MNALDTTLNTGERSHSNLFVLAVLLNSCPHGLGAPLAKLGSPPPTSY